MTQLKTENRVVWVDWMRVAACFMVLLVHATEPFYLGGEGLSMCFSRFFNPEKSAINIPIRLLVAFSPTNPFTNSAIHETPALWAGVYLWVQKK